MLFAYTILHVVISLLGIVSGFVVIYGMLHADRLPRWTAFFLATTILTNVTGFGFPFEKFQPSYVLAAVSLVLLAAATYGFYSRKLAGGWRATYVVTAILSQYVNVFVLIVQAFRKIPALNALAPTQSTEPPFMIAQGVNLLLFVILGALAVKRFRPAPAS